MGQVLLQWDQQLERGVVSTGADAAALHCHSLWDSLSIAGRLKSVYSIKGHINPITTNLVIMVFIETGAFSQSAALRPRLNTHTLIFLTSHTFNTQVYPHSLPRRFRHFRGDNIPTTLHKVAKRRCSSYRKATTAYGLMSYFFICRFAISASPTSSDDQALVEPRQEHDCTACKV